MRRLQTWKGPREMLQEGRERDKEKTKEHREMPDRRGRTILGRNRSVIPSWPS